MVKRNVVPTQTLNDMLRSCIIDFKGNWDNYLHLVEFAYNNSYHSSIPMAPMNPCTVGHIYPRLDGLKWASWVLL